MHKTSKYRGNPVITLTDGSGERWRGLTFGVRKAEMILGNLPAIKKFYDRNNVIKMKKSTRTSKKAVQKVVSNVLKIRVIKEIMKDKVDGSVIAKRFGLKKMQVAAIKAHVTMGTYK